MPGRANETRVVVLARDGQGAPAPARAHASICSQLHTGTDELTLQHCQVRVRVSRSAPDATVNTDADSSHLHSGMTVRTRCVSCARTTNPGWPLSKAAATLPFGRFLLMVLCERHLMSMDERRVSSEATCCHPLNSQVIVFIA